LLNTYYFDLFSIRVRVGWWLCTRIYRAYDFSLTLSLSRPPRLHGPNTENNNNSVSVPLCSCYVGGAEHATCSRESHSSNRRAIIRSQQHAKLCQQTAKQSRQIFRLTSARSSNKNAQLIKLQVIITGPLDKISLILFRLTTTIRNMMNIL